MSEYLLVVCLLLFVLVAVCVLGKRQHAGGVSEERGDGLSSPGVLMLMLMLLLLLLLLLCDMYC